MGPIGLGEGSRLAPIFLPEEREEQACLDFFLSELGRLRDRGLLADDAFATVSAETHSRREAIDRRGLGRAEFDAARRLMNKDRRAALDLAERSRQTDPTRQAAWSLALDLRRGLRDDAEALALCEEANARFPNFEVSVEQVRREIESRAARPDETADDPHAFPLARAREALQRGDNAGVVSLCTAQLDAQPDHYDATVLLAFALQRLGELEKALPLYRRLRVYEPASPTWGEWVQTLEQRIAERPRAKPALVFTRDPAPDPGPAVELVPRAVAGPRLSWSNVAGEFLQDHWQKLILCLAVLLIVVSSNVAASQLLGPKLWSPVGKCLLALVYTVMFAGLGAGLVKWGAERAGRIMLLTTLIVVPANFMLAGQMKLLTEPTAFGLGVLGLDAAALLLLIRLVSRSLGLGRANAPLTAALFVLSAFNAASPAGASWPWAWQFALFLAPALVFLGSVGWLTTRTQAEPFEGRYESTYFALGLLAFAFLTGMVRTGVFGLDLIPTLYALPVMAVSLACVFASTRLTRFDPDPQHAQWVRFAGLAVSGLAVALALARPPGLSPLLSGNTLAAALLGFGLYAALLCSERKPAYLYFAFGALVVSYFGAFYFAKDLMHSVEEAVRQAAGYKTPLPPPFRAINGLVFSPLLAGLSIYFRRAWGDDRLSRHCHYLGVPVSVAACVFSGFEPKAAVVCLSGYAVLYAVAVRVFSAPRLTYLATAALAGALYFGSTLRPGTTLAGQAFGAAVLGLGYWLIAAVFRVRGVEPSYRKPLDHAALALSALGDVVVLLTVWVPLTGSLSAPATFLVVALTTALVNRDVPSKWLGYLAVLGANTGLALLSLEAGQRWHGALSYAEFASAVAALGLAGTALGSWIHGLNERGTPSASRTVYPKPLHELATIQVGLALLFCGAEASARFGRLSAVDSATMALALALAAAALALLTRPYPVVTLAQLSVACGLGVWVCLVQAGHGGVLDGFGAYAATCAAYSVALIAAEEAVRAVAGKRKALDPDFRATAVPMIDLFASALPGSEVGLVFCAVGLAAAGMRNGPEVIFTFAAGSVSTLWATRLRRSERLVDLGLALAVAAAFSLTGWRVGWRDVGTGLAWLGLTSAACAFALRFLARACSDRGAAAFYAPPCLRASALLTWPVFALAVAGRIDSARAYPVSVAALGLNALTLVLLAVDRRRADYTYRAVVAAVFAVYVVIFSVRTPDPSRAYVLGLVAVSVAFVLSSAGFACRREAGEGNDLERVFARPLFRSALVLTLLAILPASESPWTMLAVSLSFLVMVKGIPSRHWIYAAVASAGSAVYFGVLVRQPAGRLVTAAMVGAYQLWLLGLLVRRAEPALVRWLRLPGRGYDYPLFHSAAVSCAVAVALRMSETGPWSDSAPLALNLAVFLLLMVKPYPHDSWIFASVGVASAAVGLAAYPRIAGGLLWVPLGMALADLWWGVARIVRRHGAPVCDRLGLGADETSAAIGLWSRLFFVLATAATSLVVLLSVAAALDGSAAVSALPSDLAGWAGLSLAIGLGCAYLVANWWGDDRAGVVMGLHGFAVLAVWWLAAPASPLVARYALSASSYLPISTALLALATVCAGLRFANRPGGPHAFWISDHDADPLARLDAFALQAGLALAVVAALLTRGRVNVTTVVTLSIATLAPALAAVVRRWVAAGYAAGLSWPAACLFAALVAARRLGMTADADQFVAVAVAMLGAAALLWVVAGALRRGGPVSPAGDGVRLPAGSVAVALEQSALVAGVLAAGLVASSTLGAHDPGARASVAAVGVLFGLALLAIGLVARWGEEWLVYGSQGSLLGGYLYYRHAFPVPAAADAAVLTLFGYLDLGLAEVMYRVGLSRFARPTRYFSLALPVLPLALGLIDGGFGHLRLVYLFTAATFYGIAGVSMRWRPLGYASAVLYNAFLWLLWGQIGWTLADRPQFFLIPVGLSAILFAEVERQSLGRQAANTTRGIGLSVIYLSLAFPVWQFASLGAWLTLLLVSLAGVFVGIGLRVQVFLWLGLTGFVLDVVYQLGRMGLEHTLAKWAIMLALGLLLILFVALNEKKRIVVTMRDYLDLARQWD